MQHVQDAVAVVEAETVDAHVHTVKLSGSCDADDGDKPCCSHRLSSLTYHTWVAIFMKVVDEEGEGGIFYEKKEETIKNKILNIFSFLFFSFSVVIFVLIRSFYLRKVWFVRG